MCGVSGTGEALREREGGTMVTVQSLGNLGWEEWRMDKWKERERRKEEGVDKNRKE